MNGLVDASSQPGVVGVAILVWSADLDAPARAATPFVMAQAACALDQQVELYFTAQAVQLLRQSNAEALIGFGHERLSVGEHLRRAVAAGAQVRACTQALHGLGLQLDALQPGCRQAGGAVQFMARCADPCWRGLVF